MLPGATVELGLAGAALTRSTVSAADGTFVFPDVRIGSYHLRVSFPGFEPFNRTLTVASSAHSPLVVVLQVSGVREDVSVVAPSIDLPATPTMQTDVSRRVIDTLPSESVSAGLSSLVTLTTPGVAADSNGGFHPLVNTRRRPSASTTSRLPISRAGRFRISSRRTPFSRSTC